MLVKTRLRLAGEISEQRDMTLLRRLIAREHACALQRPLLFCTDYVERLNATCREHLVSLTRRGRVLARRMQTLRQGMYMIGTTYNFCTPHASLRLTASECGRACVQRTPAMAVGITNYCWTVQEPLAFPVPRPR